MSELSAPTSDQRWHRCRNTDSVALEAYGLVKVAGASAENSRMVLQVQRPKKSDAYTEALAALGPAKIDAGRYGWCTFDWPAWVRYDAAETPAVGQLWGPQDDSTRLVKGNIGFMPLGAGLAEPDRVLVDHRTHYRKANWIRFSLPSAGLQTTDASVDDCTVEDSWDGFSPGSAVTVYNPAISSDYLFQGDSGDVGLAFYDPIEDRYHIAQMECPG